MVINMNQIRILKKDNFTVVDNHFIRDDNLSWKAKGLLVYLLHLPNDWVVSISDLKNRATNGRDSTSNGIQELIEKGYVTRVQIKVEGRFNGYEYTVREYPFTENPLMENPTLLSTKELSTKELSTKDNVQLNKLNESFEIFWKQYNKKKAKKKCLAKWKLLKVSDRNKIMEVLGSYLKMESDIKYRPHPLTFLNGELWNDEIVIETKDYGNRPVDNRTRPKEVIGVINGRPIYKQ